MKQMQKLTRREFLVYSALAGAGLMRGRWSFADAGKTPRFFFAVLSDPHGAADSWTNALAKAKALAASSDSEYGPLQFLLVTGDTNPIDKRFENFTSVLGGPDAPIFLPVIGNHEADDTGGFPGGMWPPGMGPGMGPNGQDTARPGMGGPLPSGGMPDGAVVQIPGNRPGIYPDDGNPAIIDMEFIRDKIVAAIPGVVRMSEGSCTYYCDVKNVRIVSIDAYSGEAGTGGIIDEKGRVWTEEAITSAPSGIDHVFIAFHSPAFPRVRHTFDSFNADTEQRNAFWNMLIAHKDKVRAAFCGHTHYYARMRVLDPAGTAANDLNAYPDEAGGIYQVNAGSTGNGMKNTFVQVGIDGKKVYFRTFEAENGKDMPFALKEQWCIQGT